MLNHVTNKMYFGTPLEEVDVTGYETWWASPVGLFENREEAVERMQSLDFPPDIIQAIPVAVCRKDGVLVYYEPCLRV